MLMYKYVDICRIEIVIQQDIYNSLSNFLFFFIIKQCGIIEEEAGYLRDLLPLLGVFGYLRMNRMSHLGV